MPLVPEIHSAWLKIYSGFGKLGVLQFSCLYANQDCTSPASGTRWKKWGSSMPGKQQLEHRAIQGTVAAWAPNIFIACQTASYNQNTKFALNKLTIEMHLHLHSKYVIHYETLCWNMVLTQFCFSYLQTLYTFFVLPAKSIHKSFSPWSWNLSLPVFQTPGLKETWSAAVGTKTLGTQPWYTSGETTHPSWGVSSRRLESKASHFILQWEVSTSLNLF